MPDTKQVEEAQEVLNRIFVKASTEQDFRAKLLAHPKAALAEFANTSEASITGDVRFIENAPGKQTIVLPDLVDANAELSSEELESVAGGVTPSYLLVTAISYSILLTSELYKKFSH